MDIFKVQAEKATCKARTTRILQEHAQAQRVLVKEQRVLTETTLLTPVIPILELESLPSTRNNWDHRTQLILQDNSDNDNKLTRPPSGQQHLTRTLTQECMMQMLSLPSKKPMPATPQLYAIPKYSDTSHSDSANAVLDDDTGELLKY